MSIILKDVKMYIDTYVHFQSENFSHNNNQYQGHITKVEG